MTAPVIERELRVAARSISTYRFRISVVGGLVAVAALLMLVASLGPATIGGGRILFGGLSIFLLVLCLFEGARSTAGSISEERREGTLGLLFLTDLRGIDIVLGKFAALGLRPLYALLAVLPILSLGVPLGGVSGAEFWRMAVVLVTNLLFSLAAGLAVSSLTASGRSAFLLALGGVGGLVGLPLLAGLVVGALANGRIIQWVMAWSPLYCYLVCDDGAYRAAGGLFWLSVAAGLFWAVCSVAVASWLTPRAWRERGLAAPAQRVAPLSRVLGSRCGGLTRRARSTEVYKPIGDGENPAMRLFARTGAYRRMNWVVLVVAALFAMMMGLGLFLDWPASVGGGAAYVAAFALGIGIRIGLASQVAYDIAGIRTGGFWELLLTTPLTQKRVLTGLGGATWRLWAAPAGFQIALQLAPWLVTLIYAFDPHAGVLFLIGPVQGAVFALDLLTLYYVSAWFALSSGKPGVAVVRAIVFTQVLPSLVCCWGILRIMTDVVFLVVAIGRLSADWRVWIEKQGGRSG